MGFLVLSIVSAAAVVLLLMQGWWFGNRKVIELLAPKHRARVGQLVALRVRGNTLPWQLFEVVIISEASFCVRPASPWQRLRTAILRRVRTPAAVLPPAEVVGRLV